MKKELIALAGQREIKYREERERERADTDLNIIFFVFCCSSSLYLFTGSVVTALSLVSN